MWQRKERAPCPVAEQSTEANDAPAQRQNASAVTESQCRLMERRGDAFQTPTDRGSREDTDQGQLEEGFEMPMGGNNINCFIAEFYVSV